MINASNQVTKTTRAALLAGSGWALVGNTGTSASTNFIGTTDAVDFVARTNNSERLRILSSGNVGIGTATPSSLLSVGSTSQFQVNSSGAIAAVTGITTSGSYTQSGTGANTFTGATTIGNTLTLSSTSSASAADSILMINASNQVTKTTRAALFAGSGWALVGNTGTSA
ncbi:MAG: hypothetical protein FGM36_16140, partial [Burkholderiaceae bacterium]|nr:hypothetical protein [Burkholderiaceae bacterium]